MSDNDVQATESGGSDATRAATGRGGGARSRADDPALARGLSRIMEEVINPVIDRTVEERQRPAVRQGLSEVMRDALNSLAEVAEERQLARAANGTPRALGDGVGAGVGALKEVQNLGFVDFTTGLITSTFDAIIAATIKQMDAYAELVADLAKSLSQFQAENVSDAHINARLADRYPDGNGGTVVRTDFDFSQENRGGNAKFQEVVEALIAETQVIREPAERLSRAATSLNIPATNTTIVKFESAHITKIRTALGRALATSMLDHLRAMAREGLARIVITDGKILSKLTFRVGATDQQSVQKSKYHSDSLNVGVRGMAGWGWGAISISAGYNQLNVNTVNESSFSNVSMNAEIIGQVEINFRTETFPPVVTAG